MKLGLGLDVWASPRFELPLERVRLAERLGFDSVWTAEIYGADAVTPLAYRAAHTRHLRLGTAIAQVAARPPTTAAMQFGTIEAMAPGRVVCGLGLSGPQVVGLDDVIGVSEEILAGRIRGRVVVDVNA